MARWCLLHRPHGAEGRDVRTGNARGGRGRCREPQGSQMLCEPRYPGRLSTQQAQLHLPHLQPHQWHHLPGFTREKVAPLSAERRLPFHITVLHFCSHF